MGSLKVAAVLAMMPMARPIIIDTDPGKDDALAILMALASPELDVRALTAVAGNIPLATGAANARRLLELAKRPEVPVYAGADAPLRRPLVTAAPHHGADGLGGVSLPEPKLVLQSAHAVDFIVEAVRRSSEPVTLCPIGPLTNIALAFERAPDIVAKVAEVVLMGGAFRSGGNTTPVAEYNIWCDPDAAAAVFASAARIVMIPLDATLQVVASPERCARVAALGTPVAAAAAQFLAYGKESTLQRGLVGPAAHDPCVIAYLLKPELFGGRQCHVAVEAASDLTRGTTVVDWWGRGDGRKNTRVITDVDADGFFDLLTRRLATYR